MPPVSPPVVPGPCRRSAEGGEVMYVPQDEAGLKRVEAELEAIRGEAE